MLNSKELYCNILNKFDTDEHPRVIFEAISKLQEMYYAFRESLGFFENKPNFKIHVDGSNIPLYDYLKKIERENSFMLNNHIYLDDRCIGNIGEWFDEDAPIPDHIVKALNLILG